MREGEREYVNGFMPVFVFVFLIVVKSVMPTIMTLSIFFFSSPLYVLLFLLLLNNI